MAAAMVSDQPPAMLPESRAASSTTKRFHVPFGLVPLKMESALAVEKEAGAGAGKVSVVPLLVG